MTLLTMIFLHIVDDYYLQGILAQMKQKKFWEEQAPDNLYKYDYIWALIMHGFSWAFMIMLPLANFRFDYPISFYGSFIFNAIIHALIDHLKANVKVINLWADQLLHMVQIIFTFMMFY